MLQFQSTINHVILSYKEKENPVTVIATQPNIDPYTEQYSLPSQEILDINLQVLDMHYRHRWRKRLSPERL